MRVVVALGGNALLERGEPADAAIQQRHVRAAAQALAPVAAEHDLIITHGNGPQVGMLAEESEADPALHEPYPLDVLVAQTQGMIGHWLVEELRNAGVAKPVVAVITHTVVDPADPAFAAPTKLIGPTYSHHHAQQLAWHNGWAVAPDGDAWRRVVASPEPQSIVELTAIRHLVTGGALVVCEGGGGVPVMQDDAGRQHGVNAVVDKDLVTALLATELRAEAMLLLTDVPAVLRDFGTDHATPIRQATTAELRGMHFPAGSMQPKVDACLRFVEETGARAAIGQLTDVTDVLAGRAGTTVVPRTHEPVGAGAGTTQRRA